MTPELALALRKPFPKESVGKLPKGGIMLDYVGHAAVTDRLLTVDPEWTWEPFALDDHGLPALDRSGNLWIRLTICGQTRIGVGDGKSAKECIGDAIRNAAMRFGVALDLWAKENLVEFAQAAGAVQVEPEAPKAGRTMQRKSPDDFNEASTDGLLLNTSSKLAKALYASLRDHGVDKDGASALYADVTGRQVESSKELTEDDARAVLRELDSWANPATPDPASDDA